LTEATDRQFAARRWKPGKVDCVQVALAHLKRFGWAPPVVPAYRTIAQAEALVAARGGRTLADMLDQVGLRRRPSPAFARPGDLAFLPGLSSDGPLGSIFIAIGHGDWKGFHEEHDGLVSMQSAALTVAWDVLP
jgi:hypothetical protein